MDLGNFERAVGARELFSRLQEKEVSLCADPRAAGFFMRALETNEHNFAALTNIVYCNQKVRLLSYEQLGSLILAFNALGADVQLARLRSLHCAAGSSASGV